VSVFGRPLEWIDETFDGDAARAYLVLAASPHAEATRNTQLHPGHHAQEAAAWDVIAIARARGWYTPTEDECADPLEDEARS
jgi:hypothetical protein